MPVYLPLLNQRHSIAAEIENYLCWTWCLIWIIHVVSYDNRRRVSEEEEEEEEESYFTHISILQLMLITGQLGLIDSNRKMLNKFIWVR